MSRPEESPPPGTSSEDLPDVFEQATADVRERILRDARRFDGDAAAVAFLEYLADHLFDRELDVDGWRRVCHLPRRTYQLVVAELGPLKPYIDDLRIAVASRLVLETGADLMDLGRRVGYDVPRTFRRAFQRRHGKSPNELRAAGKDATADETSAGADETGGGSGETGPAAGADAPLRLQAARWRRRLALGLLDRRRAEELRRLLRRTYPGLGEEASAEGDGAPAAAPWMRSPIRILSTSDRLGWFAAQRVVERALAMPDPERRRAFVHGIRFGDLIGFYLLHNVSTRLLRHDPWTAVAVAELAVEMAEAHPEKRPGENADWRALTWATLGKARLRAKDRASADAAFVHARAEWETPREKTLPLLEAQICGYEAELRKIQRRFTEAIALLDRAIEIGRETDQAALVVESCLDRVDLALITGDLATAVRILEDVLAGPPPPMEERSDDKQEAHFRSLVLFYLARAHAAAGASEAAAACFEESRELVAGTTLFYVADLDLEEARLCLRTGRLERAEELMRASRDGFENVSAVRQGTVSAELAGLLAHLGRREEARAEAERAAAFFDRLPLHREALRAARFLRSIAEAEDVSLSRLDDLARWLDVVVREVYFLPARTTTERDGKEAEGHGKKGTEVEP